VRSRHGWQVRESCWDAQCVIPPEGQASPVIGRGLSRPDSWHAWHYDNERTGATQLMTRTLWRGESAHLGRAVRDRSGSDSAESGLTDTAGAMGNDRTFLEHGLAYEWIPRVTATPHDRPSCVVIGMFDGVHRGHQAVLDSARHHADEFGLQLVAVSFDADPGSLRDRNAAVPLLQNCSGRCQRLLSRGVDAVMILQSTREFAARTPAEFLELLYAELEIAAVFAGEGFRFGADRDGDCAVLRREAKRIGFSVRIVALARHRARPISSTDIRDAIARGAIDEATGLMGAAHEVIPDVVAFHSGHQVAMFRFPPGVVRPPRGEYLGRIRRWPRLPVSIDVSEGKQLSVIRHQPGEHIDSLSDIYSSDVVLELLDTA